MSYLVSMVIVRSLHVRLASHRYDCVHHMVCLEEGLKDFAGTEGVHIHGTQQQDMLV